jgi:hypothetical protein
VKFVALRVGGLVWFASLVRFESWVSSLVRLVPRWAACFNCEGELGVLFSAHRSRDVSLSRKVVSCIVCVAFSFTRLAIIVTGGGVDLVWLIKCWADKAFAQPTC